MGGMTSAREFFVCLILAADFTVGAHTFRRVCRCVRSFSESRYPLSGMKANVGRLCEKLKNAMKSGFEQRCDGNFWTMFAGTVLDEKPNFTGGFFEWRRPFDFSTR